MNDAKNDNLNDPPGFPGKILKVSDFARAMTSFWSKKAPKLIQYQIFLSEIVFLCCLSSINPSEHELRVKQTTSLLDLSSAHKIVGAEAPCDDYTNKGAGVSSTSSDLNIGTPKYYVTSKYSSSHKVKRSSEQTKSELVLSIY